MTVKENKVDFKTSQPKCCEKKIIMRSYAITEHIQPKSPENQMRSTVTEKSHQDEGEMLPVCLEEQQCNNCSFEHGFHSWVYYRLSR